MADEGIAKYILNNSDSKNSQGRPPYWFLVGLFFSALASFTGSIKFIVVSFLIGSLVGVSFGYAKSKMLWKSWPYWLRGGVIGGGVVLLSSGFSVSCLYFFASSAWGLECLPFEIPLIPFLFVPSLASLPMISYEFIVIATWFVCGSIAGLIIGSVKSKK